MQYILIDVDGIGQMFQETYQGHMMRYVSLDGNTSFSELPIGVSARVLDTQPTQPTWALPDPVAVADLSQPTKSITVLAFRNRFTPDEKRAIYMAAQSSIDIKIWLDDLNSVQNQTVFLDDPMIIGSVHALESFGIIGQGRAQEILNA